MQKDIPQKKFLEILRVLFFPPKPQFSDLLSLLWFWREEQNLEFPKTFFGGYLFVFVEYLRDRSPKIKTKYIKNCSSILTVVNLRNWLNELPPLIRRLMLNTAVRILFITTRHP